MCTICVQVCTHPYGLIPVRKVTLTVLQEHGSMALMVQFGVQCFLQLLFGARKTEQKIRGSLTPRRSTVLDHHVLDLSVHHTLQHQQQSWHAQSCSALRDTHKQEAFAKTCRYSEDEG